MSLFSRKNSQKKTESVLSKSSDYSTGSLASVGSTTKKSRAGILVFLLSIGLGLVGMYYSRTYIEDKVDFYKTQLEKTEPMVEVIVPGRPLLQGEILVEDDLLIRPVPVTYADQNALLEANYADAVGKELAFDIDQGKPLLWAHLEGGRARTFSGMVPEGARALTVRVDEINSISGFLQPGDRIDLLMTHGLSAQNVVFPLIEKLEVIATGLQTRVDRNANGVRRSFSTITVNVSPDDAQKITLAQKLGKLTAVLRNPDDVDSLLTSPMTAARLLNKPVKKKTVVIKKEKPKPGIEYIVGGA